MYVEYLILDNNPGRVFIVGIVLYNESSCYYGTRLGYYSTHNSIF